MTSSTKTVPALDHLDKDGFADALLGWYDGHARDLPWRTGPAARASGQRPNPYHVWLSEVMLQQTTVATVTPRFAVFLDRWPSVEALAAAPLDDVLGEWAGLGYYARARNLHACANAVVSEFGGVFPQTEDLLRTLPGVGQYTAAAIAAIAYDVPATVVDGNVDRVLVRQFAIESPIRDVKSDIYDFAEALTPRVRPGDYAQAMMDLGATTCRPKTPNCSACPVARTCTAHAKGIADALPTKPAKKEKPTRYGIVYVAQRGDGAILTERREATGLFGGMAGLPGTKWQPQTCAERDDPITAVWEEVGEVRHTLSHFHLVLTVMRGKGVRVRKPYFWTASDAIDTFPTVFRKAIDLCLNSSAGVSSS